jgi:hypothetical protein
MNTTASNLIIKNILSNFNMNNTTNTSLLVDDDICDICHKPGFLEHTDCLRNFTGLLLKDVLHSMDYGTDNLENSNDISTISTTINTSTTSTTSTTNNTAIISEPSTTVKKTLHTLICRVPVQYYDSFGNHIFYKSK